MEFMNIYTLFPSLCYLRSEAWVSEKNIFDLSLGHLVCEFFSRMPIREVGLVVILSDAPYCHNPFYMRNGGAVSDSIVAEGVATLLQQRSGWRSWPQSS